MSVPDPLTIDVGDVEPTLAPRRLAELHRSLQPGERVTVTGAAAQIVIGAGFSVEDLTDRADPRPTVFEATRLRTLPDWVGPRMRLLIVGLNPSELSADVGVGFARPGNRFWPAALAAGIVTVDRDPLDALDRHRIGMTDLVKRATKRADELAPDEYRDGARRVERLVSWLAPQAVCIVGLAGWRTAVDRKAVAGPQPELWGSRPVHLMANTSGLNTHSSLADLTAHLRAAARLADRSP